MNDGRRFGRLEIIFIVIAVGYVVFAIYNNMGTEENAVVAEVATFVPEATFTPTPFGGGPAPTPGPTLTSSDEPAAWFERGQALYAQGDYGGALAHYNTALTRYEELDAYSEGLVTQAAAQPTSIWTATQTAGGVRRDDISDLFDGDIAVVRWARGDVYLALGLHAQAQADYVEAIELGLNDSEVFAGRGDAQLALGETELARASYERALELDPDNRVAALGLGRLALAEDRFAEGTDLMFRAAGGISVPDDPEPLVELARYRAENDDLVDAINLYGVAVRADATYAPAWAGRAQLRMEIEDMPGAIQDFSQVIELQPDNPEGYRARGEAYLITEEYASAAADFTVALATGEADPLLYNDRARAYTGLANYDAALADLDTAGRMEANNVPVLTTRGRVLTALDRYEEAEETLLAAVDLAGDGDVLPWLYLGDLYATTDRPDDARDAYELYVARATLEDVPVESRARWYVTGDEDGRTPRELDGAGAGTAVPTATPIPAAVGQALTTASVTVRDEPSVIGAEVTRLEPDERVSLLRSDETGAALWYEVTHPSGVGWVQADVLKMLPSGEFVALLQTSLSLRDAPTVDGGRLLTLDDGEAVTVVGIDADGGWYYVEVQGEAGWVPVSAVRVTADADLLPIVTPGAGE